MKILVYKNTSVYKILTKYNSCAIIDFVDDEKNILTNDNLDKYDYIFVPSVIDKETSERKLNIYYDTKTRELLTQVDFAKIIYKL